MHRILFALAAVVSLVLITPSAASAQERPIFWYCSGWNISEPVADNEMFYSPVFQTNASGGPTREDAERRFRERLDSEGYTFEGVDCHRFDSRRNADGARQGSIDLHAADGNTPIHYIDFNLGDADE